MAKLPLSAFDKFLKDAGASRSSEKAKIVMREAVEDYAEALAGASVALSIHAGRKTVKSEDVKLAAK